MPSWVRPDFDVLPRQWTLRDKCGDRVGVPISLFRRAHGRTSAAGRCNWHGHAFEGVDAAKGHVICVYPEERQFGAWVPGMSKGQGREKLERAMSARPKFGGRNRGGSGSGKMTETVKGIAEGRIAVAEKAQVGSWVSTTPVEVLGRALG